MGENEAKRTEEDIVCQEVEITLGEHKHIIDVKSIRKNRQFRRELGRMISEVLTEAKLDEMLNAPENTSIEDLGKGFIKNIAPALIPVAMESLIELPFIYCPDLKEYEDEATDDELVDAAITLLEISYPFIESVIRGILRLWSRAEEGGGKAKGNVVRVSRANILAD